MTDQPTPSLRFMVTCLEGGQCTVNFEPEGAQVLLSAGGILRVEITGQDDDELEISYVPGGLVIGAWSGAKTQVWDRAGRSVPI